MANAAPSFRHQVFELPKLPLEITEYQVFHGHCQHCDALSKGELPDPRIMRPETAKVLIERMKA